LLDTDVDNFINILKSSQKINECHETQATIKIINKYLLSHERPKTKTIKLLLYTKFLLVQQF
jgi:uncharacterized ubiquitin-like protein YukD